MLQLATCNRGSLSFNKMIVNVLNTMCVTANVSVFLLFAPNYHRLLRNREFLHFCNYIKHNEMYLRLCSYF